MTSSPEMKPGVWLWRLSAYRLPQKAISTVSHPNCRWLGTMHWGYLPLSDFSSLSVSAGISIAFTLVCVILLLRWLQKRRARQDVSVIIAIPVFTCILSCSFLILRLDGPTLFQITLLDSHHFRQEKKWPVFLKGFVHSVTKTSELFIFRWFAVVIFQ